MAQQVRVLITVGPVEGPPLVEVDRAETVWPPDGDGESHALLAAQRLIELLDEGKATACAQLGIVARFISEYPQDASGD